MREDEARLTGARAEFVGSLPRRLDALRAALRSAEQVPSDAERANGLLRRVHAVGAAARVLGFASVAEALTEAEKAVRKATAAGRAAPFEEVARALDLLPSLVLGAPVSLRVPESRERAPVHVWPISVLVYGSPVLADALGTSDDDTRIERERTEDPARARELARIVGPDVVIVDADRPGARELVADLVRDPLVEPVPVVVVGTFDQPEAAGAFVEFGAARVLLKPCSSDTLQRTVHELRDRAQKPRPTREPLGELTVPVLADRIAGEFKRGLVDALEGASQATRVPLGEGHDVLAAVWGAVARVRELVTLHSGGGLRFQPTGPEGAVPITPFSSEERRAGERSREPRAAEGVSLVGRRIVVADDDPAVVWFMAGLLKAVGAEVIEAHDGKQALELTYSRYPDTVISDVLMPKLDGFSLCHEIKRDVAVRDVPVILLSWKEDLLQRLRELGADADGYLRKEAAASAVVERVREVLHTRARIEGRIRAGGEVRGRLDGLTPRLVLELACRSESDLRISIRDAAFLYEVQIRRGNMRSVTRSSPDGGFLRGEAVLASLLGVSAGRFVVEPDSTACRNELSGDLLTVLARPIASARAALAQVSERSLVRLERIALDHELVSAYLECTPEPAATLTRRLLAGESARDLVLSGEVSARLLEAVLSDIARRGGLRDAVLMPSTSTPPHAPEPTPRDEPTAAETRRGFEPPLEPAGEPPPEAAANDAHAPEPPAEATEGEYEPEPDSDARPSIPMGAFAVDNDDVGWFSLAVEPSAEPPPAGAAGSAPAGAAPADAPFVPSEPPLRVAGQEPRLPLSDKATPGDWQAGPLFAFGGGEHSTLPGVGNLPRVGELPPIPFAPEPEPAPEAQPEPGRAFEPTSDPPPEARATDRAPDFPAAAANDLDALLSASDEDESPDLEIRTPGLESNGDGDDDDRATLTMPERSPVPTSPIPEAPVQNERTAPTQPPSRVVKKPAAEQKPTASEGTKKGKESVAGFFVKSVLAGVVAFFATTWIVPLLLGDGEKSAPPAEPAAEAPAAPAPPASAPAAPSGPTLRAEPIDTPAGVALDPAQGLVEVELPSESSIKVDGSFVGRYEKRRLLLAPGRHRIEVESEGWRAEFELEVAAGRAYRVAPRGSPAPASPAAPSAE
jgi:DNA-binding response OmpR family regulator